MGEQRRPDAEPAAQAELEQVLQSRGRADQVTLRFWAAVEQLFPVSELLALRRLADLHLWSDGYAEERLRWKPTQPLQVLALRVYRLPTPITLANRPEYGGCKSWLALEQPLSLEGSHPVLAETQFHDRLAQVRRALERSRTEEQQA